MQIYFDTPIDYYTIKGATTKEEATLCALEHRKKTGDVVALRYVALKYPNCYKVIAKTDNKMKAIDMVVWNTIKRLAGPNERWPGKRVYCFGSLARMEKQWLDKLHRQVKELGWQAVDGKDGNLYLVGPEKGKTT